jgi:hypothetical protein
MLEVRAVVSIRAFLKERWPNSQGISIETVRMDGNGLKQASTRWKVVCLDGME